MKLAGRTRDELIPQRGTGIAPENSFPSAASGPFNPKAADQPTGESVFPFAGRDVEYRAPASRLPLTVSAAENARTTANGNRKRRGTWSRARLGRCWRGRKCAPATHP